MTMFYPVFPSYQSFNRMLIVCMCLLLLFVADIFGLLDYDVACCI
jgi:hypothetical protein